jgi:dihydroorotate dehydrogenase electron transfer subunit
MTLPAFSHDIHHPVRRSQFIASVAANTPLCREHFRLVLSLPHFPMTQPGQFVQVLCADFDAGESADGEFDWQPGARLNLTGHELQQATSVLRRPFSLAGRRDTDGRVELDLIHRVVGLGTHWLADLRVGHKVGILGPLGNAFTPPPLDGIALLVGGGVGIPPMLYLAAALASQSRQAIAFSGAVTRDLLPLTITDDSPVNQNDPPVPRYNISEFASHQIPAVITTDDGSFGYRGFVTQALQAYLDQNCTGQKPDAPVPTIYTCGPEAMMKRVADIAIQRGIPCQVAVERAMACGMGTCQSCCIRVKKPDPAAVPLPGSDWCYRLACTDGPIFAATQLLW